MGIFDGLQFNPSGFGGQGGGLLDFLRQYAQQPGTDIGQPSPQGPNLAPDSTIPVGNYQMPMFGASLQSAAGQLPPNAQPAQGQLPQGQPAPGMPQQAQAPQMPDQQTIPSFLQPQGGINGFLNGMRGGGLVGGIQGAFGNSPADVQRQNLKAQYDALVPVLGPQKAMLAVMNPEAGKTLISEAMTNREKFQKIGQNGLGQEQYGFVNERDQTINGKPADQQPQDAIGGGIGNMNLKGADYLASLPPQQASTVQMMVEGKMPPPTSFAMSKPYWQGMIAAAKNYDPNFDETTWAARNNMQKSAQGDGKIGQNNNKLNTGIGHLTQLSDAVEGLGNSQYSQTYNGIKNALSTEFGGTGRTNFDSIVNRVAPEIVGIWRNAGGAEADIKRDIDSLKSSHTPAQLHGAISNIAGLMRSKIESNNYEYTSTMGHAPAQPFIRPDAEAALKVLEGRAAGGSAAPQQAAPSRPAPPNVGEIRSGYQFKGGNPADKNNWAPAA